MQGSDTWDSRTFGVCLIAFGATLAASAVASAFAVANHMAVAATLCEPATDHCILCVVSTASLLASVGVSAAGVILLKDRATLQRAGRDPRRRN